MTVEIKQCDREAAAKFISETDGDFAELAGLFARHRIQSEPSKMREALELARPIVEADFETAKDYSDADWIGMSEEALQKIDEALSTLPQEQKQEAATEGEGWRPIESAPKDGTVILVTNAVRGGVWVAQYSARCASGSNRENPWFSLMLNMRWHEHQYASTLPTCWMPLPKAAGEHQ